MVLYATIIKAQHFACRQNIQASAANPRRRARALQGDDCMTGNARRARLAVMLVASWGRGLGSGKIGLLSAKSVARGKTPRDTPSAP